MADLIPDSAIDFALKAADALDAKTQATAILAREVKMCRDALRAILREHDPWEPGGSLTSLGDARACLPEYADE